MTTDQAGEQRPPEDGSPADIRTAREILEHLENLQAALPRWLAGTKQHKGLTNAIARLRRAHTRKSREEADNRSEGAAIENKVREAAAIGREERSIIAAETSADAAIDSARSAKTSSRVAILSLLISCGALIVACLALFKPD
jgi:hypothetical protein